MLSLKYYCLIAGILVAAITHGQILSNQGEGKISFVQIDVSPDGKGDTLNYAFGAYIVKGNRILRNDLLNKKDERDFKMTDHPTVTIIDTPKVDARIEFGPKLNTTRSMGIARQVHPIYIIDLRDGSRNMFYHKNQKQHVNISFDTAKNDLKLEPFYTTELTNKRNVYRVELLPNTTSETIAGMKCFYAQAISATDTMLMKYTKEKSLLKSPLNLFLPETFPHTVLELVKKTFQNGKFWGLSTYRITEFHNQAVPVQLVEIPKDAVLTRLPVAQILFFTD